jgi:hypothetical protein
MFLSSPTTEDILQSISSYATAEGQVFLILLGERNTVSIPEMIDGLKYRGISFLGGIFPGVIYGDKYYDDGAVILEMPMLHPPIVVTDLTSTTELFPKVSTALETIDYKYTALLLVDGLAAGISPFIQSLFDRYGNFVNYLGGGAGSLSLQQSPCLFSNEGFFQNAAIVTFIRLKSALGVQHGWQKHAGPLVATRTHGNVINELNWENAFDIYQNIVEASSGRTLTPANFFSISKGYPFGIMKEGSEDIVRDPISVNQANEIVCVGEVPENAVLNVLQSSKLHLIEAAGKAAEQCLEQCGAGEDFLSLIFDCISRVLYLEDEFADELIAMQSRINAGCPGAEVAGVLSIGEISSLGDGYLELFNKTAVVGLLYR